MGRLDCNLNSPHLDSLAPEDVELLARDLPLALLLHELLNVHHAVAVRIEPFESKGLQPGDHVTGARVETRRLSSYAST
jgi:hypothetical protein